MSLLAVEPPTAAVAALKSMIGAHLSRAAQVDVSSLTPIKEVPVFVIDQTEPISVSDLNHLQPAAWRFVLFRKGKGEYATGDVTPTDDSYRLSMVTTSQARARELLMGIDNAEHALQDNVSAARPFELRLLEAPAFHLRAVWLHNGTDPSSRDDLFAVVKGRSPYPRDSLVTANNFVDLFNNVQLAKLKTRNIVDYNQELDTLSD
jgi:hypothetical protein